MGFQGCRGRWQLVPRIPGEDPKGRSLLGGFLESTHLVVRVPN